MIITDKRALRELKLVNSYEVDESIKTYPEDERDGRDDLQMVADEVSYYQSLYHEDGHSFKDSLDDAREFIRKTGNGKHWNPFEMTKLHMEVRLRESHDIINEEHRMVSCLKRLQKLGCTGKWSW